MHRHHGAGFRLPSQVQVAPGLHGLLGAHVHGAHEPARLVGPDREQGRVERPEPPADRAELGVVARIAGEEHPPSPRLHAPAAPQPPVAVEEATRGEVACRRAGDPDRGASHLLLDVLPPVQLSRSLDPPARHELGQADGHDPARRRLQANQAPDGVGVQVVVVVVGDEDQVQRRQLGQIEGRGHPAHGPGESDRRGSTAPDGIGEHVDGPELEQGAGVPQPGHRQLAVRRPRTGRRRTGRGEQVRVAALEQRLQLSPGEAPAEKLE